MLNILCKGRCHTLLEYIFLFLLSKSCTGISLNCSLLALMTTNLLSVHFFFSLKLCAYENRLGCQVGKTGKGWIYGEPATHFCLATMDRSRQGCNNRHYSYFEAKRTFLLTSKSSFTSSYCRDEFH